MSFLDNLFGVTKAKNAASNAAAQNRAVADNAYGQAENLQRPFYNQGVQGNEMLGNFLGINGQGNQQTAFNNYVEGPDVAFRRQQGINAIDNSSAARSGGVPSGGLLKRLTEFGTGLATRDYGNYLQRLGTVANSGQSAANQLTNANYQSAGITSGANTAEGNAIANASLAGGNILGNLVGGAFNLAGNMGFNPFRSNTSGGSQQGTLNTDPWQGYR